MPTTIECPVDLAEGLRRAGDDREFYRELLQLFAEESAAQLRQLEACVEDGDLDGVVRIAHSLKGASANLSAGPVHEAALALEIAGREGRDREIAPLVSRLTARLGELDAFTASFE